jgi:hypothetical protein
MNWPRIAIFLVALLCALDSPSRVGRNVRQRLWSPSYSTKVSDPFSVAKRPFASAARVARQPKLLLVFGIDRQLAPRPKAAGNVANVTSFPPI